MLSKLDKEIIFILMNSLKELTSDQISLALSKSSKTVQNHIKTMNKELQSYGAVIEIKKGSGYLLIIHDKEQFSQLQLFEEHIVDDQDIVDTLVNEFIHAHDYIKADDLVEKLYISKSKLTQSLNVIRDILKKYDLFLDVKSHKGLKIVGDEFDFRRFISSNYVQKSYMFFSDDLKSGSQNKQSDEDKKLYNQVYHIVSHQIEKLNYTMPHYILEGLVRHLFVMVKRINKGQSIHWSEETKGFDMTSNQYLEEKIFTEAILKGMTEYFQIDFPESEYQYILLHVLSKKVLSISDKQSIPEDINKLVEVIISKIKQIKGIDLCEDFDLRMMLALHLVPLKLRLQYGLILRNPLLKEIQVQCIAGYDLAIIASCIIKEEWDSYLTDDEISYLALHFDVALNRQAHPIMKKSILIVCGSGRASAQLLKYKFMQYFTNYLQKIEVCDVTEFDCIDLAGYDYIFTTISLKKKTTIPVFEFSFFLNEVMIQKIESVLKGNQQTTNILSYFPEKLFFPHMKVSSQKEAFDFLFRKLKVEKNITSFFEQSVLEREHMAGTDLITNVALPHPNSSITEDTFISVVILDKPILWTNHKIRIIFLISMGQGDSMQYKPIFEMLIRMLSSQETIQKLIKNQTYDNLCKILLDFDNERNI